jgi:predicted ATPase with chaperone activity
VRPLCALDEAGEHPRELAMKERVFNAPAHDRLLKVACTVAALDRTVRVEAKHLAEVIPYRSLDPTANPKITKKATQRIYHAPANASFIQLPLP